MSAAMGETIDIPMMLRLLAGNLYTNPHGLALLEERNIHIMLDAGVDVDDPTALVEHYHKGWWISKNEPAGHLYFDDLDEALAMHRKQRHNDEIPSSPKLNKKTYTWTRHLSLISEGASSKCKNCRLYRGVALGVMDNLKDLRHNVHSLEVASDLRATLAERKAAGFFQIYEAVLMKELTENAPKKGKSKSSGSSSRMASKVQADAAAEFNRLKDLPSQKWTWGTELSSDEVLNLRKPFKPLGRQEHSGYDLSLPWGKWGDNSNPPEPPCLSQRVSDIADDNRDIPELDSKDIPTHFNTFPLRQKFGDPPADLKLPRYRRRNISPFPDTSNNFFPPPPLPLYKSSTAHGAIYKSSRNPGAADTDSDISIAAVNVFSDRSSSVSINNSESICSAQSDERMAGG